MPSTTCGCVWQPEPDWQDIPACQESADTERRMREEWEQEWQREAAEHERQCPLSAHYEGPREGSND